MRKQSDKSRLQGIQYNQSGCFASVNVDERLKKRLFQVKRYDNQMKHYNPGLDPGSEK